MRRSALVSAVFVLLISRGASAQEADSSRMTGRLPNPTAAMVRSFILPGWGQWYNGRKWKAGLFFAAEVGLAAYALYQDQMAASAATYEDRFYCEDRRNLAFWWMAGTALLAGLDAYVDAHLAGFDVSEDLSVAPSLRPGVGLAFTVRW